MRGVAMAMAFPSCVSIINGARKRLVPTINCASTAIASVVQTRSNVAKILLISTFVAMISNSRNRELAPTKNRASMANAFAPMNKSVVAKDSPKFAKTAIGNRASSANPLVSSVATARVFAPKRRQNASKTKSIRAPMARGTMASPAVPANRARREHANV